MAQKKIAKKKQEKAPAMLRHSKFPKLGTVACREYFLGYAQINSFLNFILHNVSAIEHTVRIAHEALVQTERDPGKKKELETAWESRTGPVDALRKQRQFLLEIILVRHIDNYLNYLSTLLFEIFTQRPETLRSTDKVEVEEILRHSTIDEVVRSLAERKVRTLSFISFGELTEFFSKRFSLSLVTKKEYPKIVHAIEVRNISVHSRCLVDRQFVARTQDSSTPIGERMDIVLGYLDDVIPILEASVRKLDRQARSHLKLTGKRFNVEPNAA